MLKTCSECGKVFDLLPGKPGFANICPTCTRERERSARIAAEQEHLRTALNESVRENEESREKAIENDPARQQARNSGKRLGTRVND